MIATKDILKGQEVVNCYGQLSNSELLRGYGYVEQHNSIKHVQVPAQFCIKAAAAANTVCEAPGKKRRKHHHAVRDKAGTLQHMAAAAGDHDHEHEHEPSNCQLEDSDASPDESSLSDKEDESSAGDVESSGDDSESEPIWELEDDSEDLLVQQWKRQKQYYAITASQPISNKQHQPGQQASKRSRKKQGHTSQQQQQVMQVPCLAEATEQLEDWEERWRLCHSLRLLPKNGVFQLESGDLAVSASPLLAVLLLLVADSTDCAELAAASAPAAGTAAVTAAAAAAANGTAGIQNASQPAHSKDKKQLIQQQQSRKKPQQQQQQGVDKCASHEGCTDTQPLPALLCNVDDKVLRERLRSALHHLVALMHSRYTCSLQEDQTLLQQHDSNAAGLAPRVEAAVMARIAEKEVLRDMHQVRHMMLRDTKEVRHMVQCLWSAQAGKDGREAGYQHHGALSCLVR